MQRIEKIQVTQTATATTYEEVRESFIVCLRGEQAHLKMLREALEAADGFPVEVFGDLERFAHRLRGAAAVFAMPQLRDAAKLLEQAAAAALARHAAGSDLRLRRSTQLLAGRLTRFDRDNGSKQG